MLFGQILPQHSTYVMEKLHTYRDVLLPLLGSKISGIRVNCEFSLLMAIWFRRDDLDSSSEFLFSFRLAL